MAPTGDARIFFASARARRRAGAIAVVVERVDDCGRARSRAVTFQTVTTRCAKVRRATTTRANARARRLERIFTRRT
jgi:hypothetical protein